MNAKVQLRILILGLVFVGLGLALTKHFRVGYPLFPKEQISIWSIEAKITFRATGDPIKLNFAVPGEQSDFGILKETASSEGFGYTSAPERDAQTDFYRKVTWSKEGASGWQELYYRIDVYEKPGLDKLDLSSPTVEPDTRYDEGKFAVATEELITKAKQRSADIETFTSQLIQLLDNEENQNVQTLLNVAKSPLDRIKLLNTLIIKAGYESHILRVLKLGESTSRQTLTPIVFVLDRENETRKAFEWGNPLPRPRGQYMLAWQRGGPALIELYGGRNARVDFAVAKQDLAADFVLEQAARQMDNRLTDFSLTSLSIEQQNSYRLLLMIPFGALVVVILRNIIGIKTSGTFMPILLAMAFLKTELLPGICLFIIVVGAGLTMRSYLSKLDLLLVPRISAVVVVVIGIMVGFGIFGTKFNIDIMQSVTLFPTIILAWTVERLSVLWEEDGPKEVATQTGGSLFVAVLAYLVMAHPTLRYQVFIFPELLLVVLAVILSLGQYSGYRLTELIRFAPMAKQDTEGQA